MIHEHSDQWRIQDFPKVVHQLQKVLLFFNFIPENWKNLDPMGGVHGAPLNAPMQMVREHSAVIEWRTVFSRVYRVEMYSAVQRAAGLSAASQNAVHRTADQKTVHRATRLSAACQNTVHGVADQTVCSESQNTVCTEPWVRTLFTEPARLSAAGQNTVHRAGRTVCHQSEHCSQSHQTVCRQSERCSQSPPDCLLPVRTLFTEWHQTVCCRSVCCEKEYRRTFKKGGGSSYTVHKTTGLIPCRLRDRDPVSLPHSDCNTCRQSTHTVQRSPLLLSATLNKKEI